MYYLCLFLHHEQLAPIGFMEAKMDCFLLVIWRRFILYFKLLNQWEWELEWEYMTVFGVAVVSFPALPTPPFLYFNTHRYTHTYQLSIPPPRDLYESLQHPLMKSSNPFYTTGYQLFPLPALPCPVLPCPALPRWIHVWSSTGRKKKEGRYIGAVHCLTLFDFCWCWIPV